MYFMTCKVNQRQRMQKRKQEELLLSVAVVCGKGGEGWTALKGKIGFQR